MGTLQVEPRRLETPAAMTFDEVSMERSKSFVLALQELRNLKPQLYSAAEYCEKSYLHNEQKQMVLDNLKDYAVRALVNAVDHLGTVAYKLTDLFEKQSSDISDVELKISCLDQQILTCQSYMDKEGLRQQQLLESAPRHHKRYILPNNAHNKVQTKPQQVHGAGQSQSTSKLQCPVSPASKTLSWHLAADSTSTPNKSSRVPSEQDTMPFSYEGSKGYKATPEDFHLLDAVEATEPRPLSPHLQSRDGASHPPLTAPRPFGSLDLLEDPKYFPSFKSSGSPIHREVCRPSARNKGVFSAFFAKNKYPKQKKAYA